MGMAALSPNSVLASPIQVNPQVKTDLQTSVPQIAQEAEKTSKVAQTDTITISAQALKRADDQYVATKETAKNADEQQALQAARNKADNAKNGNQKYAENAYAAIGLGQ